MSSQAPFTGLAAMSSRPLPTTGNKRKGPPMCYKPKQPAKEPIPSDGTMKFTVMRQVKESFEQFNELRQEKRLCDVSLVSSGVKFHCHKVVLASASPYFNAMFKEGMVECCKKEVEIPLIPSDTLATLIDFIYTAEISVTSDSICSLMQAAMLLDMPHVIEACTTFLEHQLDPSNCIGIAAFAHQYNCIELERRAKRYILKKFSDVRLGDEFLAISYEELDKIISSKEMTVKCESEVYTAVLTWVGHDIDGRGCQLAKLLEKIRIGNIPPDFIRKQIDKCKVLRKVPNNCLEKLNKMFNELKMHTCHSEPPRVPCEKQVIYCIGGYLNVSRRDTEYYNPQDGQWRRVNDMPHARSGLAACTIQGLVYAVGGRNNSVHNNNEDLSVVDCYNPRSNEWSHIAPMHFPRNRVAVAVLDNRLYAAGGSSAAEGLKSVECYDPLEHRWRMVAEMSCKRIAAGLTVVNRFLYAVGGFNGQERLSSMEKYYPEEDRWISCPPMSTRRSGAGVCGLGLYIYVAGGFDSTTQLNTVERYNTQTEEWEHVAPMRYPRSALSLIAANGQLFALGGYGGSRFVEVIESYNPETNVWRDVSQMQSGRSGQGVTIGPLPEGT